MVESVGDVIGLIVSREETWEEERGLVCGLRELKRREKETATGRIVQSTGGVPRRRSGCIGSGCEIEGLNPAMRLEVPKLVMRVGLDARWICAWAPPTRTGMFRQIAAESIR